MKRPHGGLESRWLRAWHGCHAGAFLLLLASGLSLHYADAGFVLIPFRIAVLAHNGAGCLLVALWLWFVVANRASHNSRQYRVRASDLKRGLVAQLRHYAWGMFRGESLLQEQADKFNPAQRVAYALVMYGLTPLTALSGVALLFPWLAPQKAGNLPGLLPMALLHLASGYLMTLFLVVHVYLALTCRDSADPDRPAASGE